MEVTVSGRGFDPGWLDATRDAVAFALEAEGVPADVEVAVALVDDSAMAAMNSQYRGVEGPTDVLAFPCEAIDEERPAGSEIAIGDIAIAPAIAMSQAEALGGTVEEELELLAVHGTLHLLGYDHQGGDAARAMEQRQTEILAALRRRRGDHSR